MKNDDASIQNESLPFNVTINIVKSCFVVWKTAKEGKERPSTTSDALGPVKLRVF